MAHLYANVHLKFKASIALHFLSNLTYYHINVNINKLIVITIQTLLLTLKNIFSVFNIAIT